MEGRVYTTTEAAKWIGVSRQTLYSWMDSGSVEAPKLIKAGRRSMRLWTMAQLQQAKKFKGTLKPGRAKKKKR